MPADYSFTENDTGSVLQVTCTNKADAAAIDLTGATVKLRWVNAGSVAIEKAMTLVDAPAGIVKYQFAAGELEAGEMEFEIEITNGAEVLTSTSVLKEAVRKEIA